MWYPDWMDGARARWRSAVCTLRLAFVVLRSWLRSTLGRTAGGKHGPSVYRMYAFNEGEGEGFYQELPPGMLDPPTWEEDVRHSTGWQTFRLEVRYVFRGKKYRMVLRPGDACTFPPYQEHCAPACRLPRGVLSARLQGPPGSDIDCDVMSRVLKYQGPRGDFHAGLGLGTRLQDMFPFDDQADNAARFTHLRVLDTSARLYDLPYSANGAMAAINKTQMPGA